MSGGSSANIRASSPIISSPAGESRSPLRLNATATSPLRPPSAIASRATRGRAERPPSSGPSRRCSLAARALVGSSAVGSPQVFVVSTSPPAST